MKYTFPLYLIAIALIIISLQNSGIIRPYYNHKFSVDVIGPVQISGAKSGLDLDLFGVRPVKVKIEEQ